MDVTRRFDHREGKSMNLSRRNKILIITASTILLGLFVYAFIPKTVVTFAVAPGTVDVLIDGKEKMSLKNGDSQGISAGKHTFIVSRSEFSPYTTTLDVKPGEKTELLAALTPLTDAAKKLLDDDVSQSVIQRFYGSTFTKQSEKVSSENPIISILPLQARLYRLYVCPSAKYPNDVTKVAVCADMYHEGLQPYIEKDLSSRGFKPIDYEIIYNDKYTQNTAED